MPSFFLQCTIMDFLLTLLEPVNSRQTFSNNLPDMLYLIFI